MIAEKRKIFSLLSFLAINCGRDGILCAARHVAWQHALQQIVTLAVGGLIQTIMFDSSTVYTTM